LAFAQATDIDPEFDQAGYNKGVALLRLRKYLEAIRAFDKALTLNPYDQEARCQRDVAQRAIIGSAESSTPSLKDQKKLF
jgi:tetratricopeptide (TPR) repeat protein